MFLAGLTGGIGSGKSAAARRFVAAGIPVIDADQIGHQLLEEGGAAVPGVIALFGESCSRSGAIDRELLAGRVFHDPEAMALLNALMHPLVAVEVMRRCAALAEKGPSVVLVEAALLAEQGAKEPWMNALILVVCPEAVRVRRLVEHRGMKHEDARARIAMQTPPEAKVALADWVIDNIGTLEALHRQVDQIATELRARAAELQSRCT